MISICIPIYNSQVYNLGVTLVEQCLASQIPFEVIFIDDSSDEEYKKYNTALSDISNVKYYQLAKNIGRSAIRNLFLKYVNFEYLLFLDCDLDIQDNQFIARYVNTISQGALIVCGGLRYPQKHEIETITLRWKYGIKKECIPAINRRKKPYHSFLSSNFLIRRDIFEQIKFDERISSYGHEDTLFGYSLMKKSISITHIENPTIHRHMENNEDFLRKSRQAVENLYYIYKDLNPGKDFEKEVKLLRTFSLIKKIYLSKIIAVLFWIFNQVFKYLFITKRISNLRLFDLYKLGYLCFFGSFRYKRSKS
jgi:glycosyltransferase involved in cell wall biosynthesis